MGKKKDQPGILRAGESWNSFGGGSRDKESLGEEEKNVDSGRDYGSLENVLKPGIQKLFTLCLIK